MIARILTAMILISLPLCIVVGAPSAPWLMDARGYKVAPAGPCLTDQERAEIRAELLTQEKLLRAKGQIGTYATSHPLFTWPLRKNPYIQEPDFWASPGYLDENRNSGAVRDYMGGTECYDNHTGTDSGISFLPWIQQSMNTTRIVAAADGVILRKLDDAYDRSCGIAPRYNGIFLRHRDGSQAWYIHTKRKSLTSRDVGEWVKQGEYLGLMGSAGNSTAPHLHFEVYDSAGRLIDPYYGPYNKLNKETWWARQPQYRNPAITLLLLSDMPGLKFPPCPIAEITHAADSFRPGQLVIFNVFYRDTKGPQSAELQVLRPDGTTQYKWDSKIDVTWDVLIQAWAWYIPSNGPAGDWKFQAKYLGKTYSEVFRVSQARSPMKITALSPSTIKAGAITEVQINGNAFHPGTGLVIHKSLMQDDPAIFVRSIQYRSSTLLVARIEAQRGALTGPHAVVLTRPDFVQAIKQAGLTVVQ